MANPFSLPVDTAASSDINALKQLTNHYKEQQHASKAQQKIWQKGSGNVLSVSEHQQQRSTIPRTHRKPVVKAYAAAAQQMLDNVDSKPSSAPSLSKPRTLERSNLSSFIQQKRDLFLIQMSLETKKAEILKLEEKCTVKESALRKAEQLLENDAARFDAFLRANDSAAHSTLNEADAVTKEKHTKVLEIKKLNYEIQKLENENLKYVESLELYMKYKEFLDSLTPVEWLEQQLEKREKLWQQQQQITNDSQNKQGEEEKSAAPPAEQLEMYFTNPSQLLNIFTSLEERNLFLIQNVQETEEALEELKERYTTTEQHIHSSLSTLEGQIQELKMKINREEDYYTLLRTKKSNSSGGTTQQSVVFQMLQQEIQKVYQRCGFEHSSSAAGTAAGNSGSQSASVAAPALAQNNTAATTSAANNSSSSSLETLDKLREIEIWLEKLLTLISQMDPQKVEQAEKRKNIQRRNQIRNEKKLEAARVYEERLKKSTERANAEIYRRVGKPEMKRSEPIRKRREVVKEEVEDDVEAQMLKQFFEP